MSQSQSQLVPRSSDLAKADKSGSVNGTNDKTHTLFSKGLQSMRTGPNQSEGGGRGLH